MLFTIRSGATKHPEDTVLQFNTDLIETGGVRNLTTDLLTVEPSGGGLNVDVGIGRAYLKKSTTTNAYPIRNTTVATVPVDENASGSPRLDSLVVYIDLSIVPAVDSQGEDVTFFRVVPGTPAGSPVAPNNSQIEAEIGALNPYVVLYDVAVANGAVGISNANITDQRTKLVMSDLIPVPEDPSLVKTYVASIAGSSSTTGSDTLIASSSTPVVVDVTSNVLLKLSCSNYNTGAIANIKTRFYKAGGAIGQQTTHKPQGTGIEEWKHYEYLETSVAPGSYTYDVRGRVDGGTGQWQKGQFIIEIIPVN